MDELQAEVEADLDLSSLEEVEVSEPHELGAVATKAAAATALLTTHKAKLQDELSNRRKLVLLLASSVERQRDQCQRLSAALAACDGQLHTAQQAAEQVSAMQAQMAAIAQEAAEAL